MKEVAIGLAVMVALVGCRAVEPSQAVPAELAAPVPAVPGDCRFVISFGSYAMGIDRGSLVKVEALFARDAAVRKVERFPWGREGELSLCVRLRRESDGAGLFGRVKALLPAEPRGPITLSTNGGLGFTTPLPLR